MTYETLKDQKVVYASNGGATRCKRTIRLVHVPEGYESRHGAIRLFKDWFVVYEDQKNQCWYVASMTSPIRDRIKKLVRELGG